MLKSRWFNTPVNNPTQNRWVRAVKSPWGDWNTGFDKMRADMEKRIGRVETPYDKYLLPIEGGV